MFDWRKIAPDRCYLCGATIAHGEGDREHYIGRQFHPSGRIPNVDGRVEPLPSHRECNRSTMRDEDRVAMAWALTDPMAHTRPERYERAMRGLKREKAAGLRASFVANMQRLAVGGLIKVPGLSVHYVVAKMVRGLFYLDSGHVFGPDVRWSITGVTLWDMLETVGTTVEVPDVLRAKYLADPEAPDRSMCFLQVYAGHVVLAVTDREGGVIAEVHGEDGVALNWPRKREE